MTAVTNQAIADVVYDLVESIPTGISGTLLTLVNHSIYQVENYIGEDISISSVSDAYQPAVTNFTVASVLGQIEAQGIGTKSVKIGELSITKGMVEGAANNFKQMGYKQLDDLPKKVNYYQTWV